MLGEDGESKKDKEKDYHKDTPKDAGMEAVRETSLTGRKSTPEPRFDPEKYEPVVKTPPEPTRVKSPDQVGKWVRVDHFYYLFKCSAL